MNSPAINTTGPFDLLRSLALEGDVQGMAALLDAGHDANAANGSRETVFLHCCANNRLAAAKLLVGRGADVNLPDHGGSTPMDFALRHASPGFCAWLERVGGRGHDSSIYATAGHGS